MIALREFPWLACWFLGGGILAGFLLSWTSGDHFLVARLLNYLMPWLLLPLAVGMLLAALTYRWWLGSFLAVPALAIVLTYAPLFWPVWQLRGTPEEIPGEPVLKVMSYNVWSRNGKTAETIGLIAQEDPDLLLLQEIPVERFAALRQLLADGRPGEVLYASYEQHLLQGVLSRFPIVPLKAMRKLGQAQKVAVDTPVGRVTVFNVHPLRSGGWQRRDRQIVALVEQEILETRGAVILGGDFNTTDQTQLYRRLSRHLRNAHWEAGFGFGFTYPSAEIRLLGLGLPPLVRIDHIFYNDHFRALAAGTSRNSGGSDHYPVTARLAFKSVQDSEPPPSVGSGGGDVQTSTR